MGIYHELLEFGIQPLREGYELPKGTAAETMFRPPVEEILNPELIAFFKSNIAPITKILLFHQQPHKFVQPIHLDGYGPFQLCVNWVFSDNYIMRFFEPLIDMPEKQDVSLYGAPYKKFLPHEVKLVETTSDKGPFLASVGSTPHQAQNLSDTDRWALSLRLPNHLFQNWETGLAKFAPWIINER